MTERIWEQYWTDDDCRAMASAGYAKAMGFGERPALLIVDVSYNFCGDKSEPLLESIKTWRNSCGVAAWEAIAVIQRLIRASHARQVPVFYSTNTRRVDGFDAGSWRWKNARELDDPEQEIRGNAIVAEIAPQDRDVVIYKTKPSAFFGTPLLSFLVDLRVDTLVVCGVSTSGCVRATVVDAFSNNLRVQVVEDACFDRSEVSHAVNLGDMDAKYADVVLSERVLDVFAGLDEAVQAAGRPRLGRSPSPAMKTAFWNYDRTTPLCDGRVDLGGLALEIEILRPEQTFAMAYQGQGFDICEASFSNTVTMTSLGACPYVLVPAFVSRAFRHGAVFVRTDRAIHSPQDLAGKIVGLQEYDMTAAIVVRGILRDEYGVQESSIDWRIGDRERLKPLAFPLGAPPEGVSLTLRAAGSSLEDGLMSGELDAIISLRTPQSIKDGQKDVRRLFEDRTEREWFARRRHFPIMHAIGVRRTLAEANPGLTRTVYDVFKAAKDLAVADLEITQVPKVTLPWPHVIVQEVRNLMGQDFWPYGIAANEDVLQTQLRWSFEDGLQARPIDIADIFAADCLDT